MADTKNLPVGSASFDQIKSDLIGYFSKQNEFKDYDFFGSRLNVLMDILAYNTLYMQQYSNAALYERFIRTAHKRSSIIQHAQDMGYNPSSYSASRTNLRIQGIHALNPPVVNIPVGTRFTASVENTEQYDYVNWDSVQILRNPDNTYSGRIDVVQGIIGQYDIIYQEGQPIILRDKDIDRNYIRVYVDEAEWTNWTDKSIVNTTGGSSVFYVRETISGATEIYFGEGEKQELVESGEGAFDPSFIGGLRPITGQNIRIEFLKTSGEVANGSRGFAFADSIENFEVQQVIENPDDDPNYTGSAGGGQPESTERIRALAPIYREAQRRCVTKLDYETFVSQKFANYVQAIQAYGDSSRPGYVFIAIKPKDGLSLTTTQKEDIENYLKEFNIVTITPRVVDPNYLYINHKIRVNYKQGSLPEGTDFLKSRIVEAISKYYEDEVEIFNSSFHVSRMLTYVDESHVSVLGSRCDIELVRESENYYRTPMAGYSFMNPVQQRTVSTSEIEFIPGEYNVSLKSTDGEFSGKILIGPFADGDVTVLPEYTENDFDRVEISGRNKYYEIGTIIYDTGRMDYDFGALGLSPDAFDAARVIFTSSPVRTNIYVDDGSLCVYEYNLRPEYTTIELEAIN